MNNSFALLLLVLVPLTLQAAVVNGRVVGIADGDTFTLLTNDKQQVKIRVAEIDAPEREQPYSNRSRQLLSDLLYHKEVQVDIQTTDRYGRIVGRPYVDDLDVSAEMVRQGAAWAYRKYLRDEALLAFERQARNARRGIWSLPETQRVPPWEWRHGGTADSEAASKGKASERCSIKGNIGSSGQRIYHVPGQRYYESTKINEAMGERWFCSESEARAAGWRKSRV